MTAPASSAVALYLNGVDITSHVPFESYEFNDYAHSVSTLSFKIEDASAITVNFLDNIQLVFTGLTIAATRFIGYVMNVEQSKRDNGITIEYQIDCEDRKVRLQKSVLPYKQYTGLDSDILADLLNDAYPDLSDIYDFSDLVNSLGDNTLDVNDDNLLDKINELADKNGAKWRIDPPAGDSAIITFDDGGWGSQLTNLADGVGWFIYHAFLITGGVVNSGNPGNCAKWTDNVSLNSITSGTTIGMIEANLGGSYHFTQISFDYYVTGSSSIKVFEGITGQESAIAGTGAWHSITFTLDDTGVFPSVGFKASANINTSVVNLDLRIDNVQFTSSTAYPDSAGKDKLVWDSDADNTDFDFDIDNSDEFGYDFNLNLGGYDNFNAVVVTGGVEEVDISWTYHGNIYELHLGLETAVKDIVVSVNTNTDLSPSWSAIAVGEWGKDELLADGGSMDCLYDPKDHWLYFDTGVTILTLDRAIKVEGKILKPIRVLVNNAVGDTPILATSHYDESISSSDQALAVGQGLLQKRDTLQRITFTTYEPGLKPGQKLGITDSARGLSASLIIQSIKTKWIGGQTARYEVDCGNDEGEDVSITIADTDARSRKKASPAAIGTTSYESLTDDSGVILTDDLGATLYEAV